MPPDDNATKMGLSEAVGPVGDTATLRVTLPEKPLRLVRVIVEFPDDPCTMLKVVGLEDMLKSVPTTVTATVAGWDSDPLVPVTAMVYVPAGVEAVVEIVRVDVPVPPAVRVTGFTLNEKVRPATGAVLDAARFTLPAKLFRLVSEMVEVAELPATKLAGVVALAEILKSGVAGAWTMNLPNIGPLCMKHQYV